MQQSQQSQQNPNKTSMDNLINTNKLAEHMQFVLNYIKSSQNMNIDKPPFIEIWSKYQKKELSVLSECDRLLLTHITLASQLEYMTNQSTTIANFSVHIITQVLLRAYNNNAQWLVHAFIEDITDALYAFYYADIHQQMDSEHCISCQPCIFKRLYDCMFDIYLTLYASPDTNVTNHEQWITLSPVIIAPFNASEKWNVPSFSFELQSIQQLNGIRKCFMDILRILLPKIYNKNCRILEKVNKIIGIYTSSWSQTFIENHFIHLQVFNDTTDDMSVREYCLEILPAKYASGMKEIEETVDYSSEFTATEKYSIEEYSSDEEKDEILVEYESTSEINESYSEMNESYSEMTENESNSQMLENGSKISHELIEKVNNLETNMECVEYALHLFNHLLHNSNTFDNYINISGIISSFAWMLITYADNNPTVRIFDEQLACLYSILYQKLKVKQTFDDKNDTNIDKSLANMVKLAPMMLNTPLSSLKSAICLFVTEVMKIYANQRKIVIYFIFQNLILNNLPENDSLIIDFEQHQIIAEWLSQIIDSLQPYCRNLLLSSLIEKRTYYLYLKSTNNLKDYQTIEICEDLNVMDHLWAKLSSILHKTNVSEIDEKDIHDCHEILYNLNLCVRIWLPFNDEILLNLRQKLLENVGCFIYWLKKRYIIDKRLLNMVHITLQMIGFLCEHKYITHKEMYPLPNEQLINVSNGGISAVITDIPPSENMEKYQIGQNVNQILEEMFKYPMNYHLNEIIFCDIFLLMSHLKIELYARSLLNCMLKIVLSNKSQISYFLKCRALQILPIIVNRYSTKNRCQFAKKIMKSIQSFNNPILMKETKKCKSHLSCISTHSSFDSDFYVEIESTFSYRFLTCNHVSFLVSNDEKKTRRKISLRFKCETCDVKVEDDSEMKEVKNESSHDSSVEVLNTHLNTDAYEIMSLESKLIHNISLLSNDSSFVKRNGLQLLLDIMQDNAKRSEFECLISPNTGNIGLIRNFINGLQSIGDSCDRNVLLLGAECFGELGVYYYPELNVIPDEGGIEEETYPAFNNYKISSSNFNRKLKQRVSDIIMDEIVLGERKVNEINSIPEHFKSVSELCCAVIDRYLLPIYQSSTDLKMKNEVQCVLRTLSKICQPTLPSISSKNAYEYKDKSNGNSVHSEPNSIFNELISGSAEFSVNLWIYRFCKRLISELILIYDNFNEENISMTYIAMDEKVRCILEENEKKKKTFSSLLRILENHIQICKYLLPFLMEEVLKLAHRPLYTYIAQEIRDIMQNVRPIENSDDIPSTFVGNTFIFSSYSSKECMIKRIHEKQLCAQYIFYLFDVLMSWNSKISNFSQIMKEIKKVSSSDSNHFSIESKTNLEHARSMIAVFQPFLDGLPYYSLAKAAYDCKSFIRALIYIEIHFKHIMNENIDGEYLDLTAIQTSELKENEIQLWRNIHRGIKDIDGIFGAAEITNLSKNNTKEQQALDFEAKGDWRRAYALYDGIRNNTQKLKMGYFRCSILFGYFADVLMHTKGILQPSNIDFNANTDYRSLKEAMDAFVDNSGINDERNSKFIEDIHSFAVQSLWRLGDWTALEEIASKNNNSSFESRIGLLLSMHHSHNFKSPVINSALHKMIDSANVSAMKSIFINRESQHAVEEYAVQLQMLREFLQFESHCTDDDEDIDLVMDMNNDIKRLSIEMFENTNGVSNYFHWNKKLNRSRKSLTVREPILNFRRILFNISGKVEEEAFCWLQLAKEQRFHHLISTAKKSLHTCEEMIEKNVPAMNFIKWQVSLERVKLLHVEEKKEALLLAKEYVSNADKKECNSVPISHVLSEMRILIADWMLMDESHAYTEIFAEYENAIKIHPNCKEAHFKLAVFLDSRYLSHLDGPQGRKRNTKCLMYLSHMMQHYMISLQNCDRHMYQSLPRVVDLWLEHGQLLIDDNINDSRIADPIFTALNKSESKLWNMYFNEWIDSLPCYEWMCILPNIMCHLTSSQIHIKEFIHNVIGRLFVKYPSQILWKIALSVNSESTDVKVKQNRERRKCALSLMKHLEKVSGRANSRRLIKYYSSLLQQMRHILYNFEQFISVVKPLEMPDYLTGNYDWKAVVPTLSNLNNMFPVDERIDWASAPVTIVKFSTHFKIMNSKERPKQIFVLGSDGKCYPFLLKKEKDGDMRKDARMMEICAGVNRMLDSDAEGRARNLHLQLFSVVIITEQIGLVEWVKNVDTVRKLLQQTFIHDAVHRKAEKIADEAEMVPKELNFNGIVSNMRKILAKEQLLWKASKRTDDEIEQFYRERIIPVSPPVLMQKYFRINSSDLSAFYNARLRFARSSASWAIFGFVIGLGDRHVDNILIKPNGEVMMVDFDCMLGKGTNFTFAEQVPFRFTPAMIDGCGPNGVYGGFYSSAKISMRVLRENSATVLNSMASFVSDPMMDHRSCFQKSMSEMEVKQNLVQRKLLGKKNLKLVSLRLDGHVPIFNKIKGYPTVDSFSKCFESDEQVRRLIKQATNIRFFSLMFSGWMAFV